MTWKVDYETIEMCVDYFIKQSFIKQEHKWTFVEDMKKQFKVEAGGQMNWEVVKRKIQRRVAREYDNVNWVFDDTEIIARIAWEEGGRK